MAKKNTKLPVNTKLVKRESLAKQFHFESKLVRKESMRILREFNGAEEIS